MNRPPLLAILAALCAAATACGLPKDSEGTLERIRGARVIRVGLILSRPDAPLDRRAEALLRRLQAATGASPRIFPGDGEPLLARLEEGEVDLVIGRFTATTPWSTLVSLTPPLAKTKQGKTEIILAAAMQNGENEWISLVEREARALPETEK
jgi:ABC-type amino acid transport substrate-binding protein